MKHYNQLTPAEAERLALLAEECSEVIQIVGKILRHGLSSWHPDDEMQKANRALLETELGHVRAAAELMQKAGTISGEHIELECASKLSRVGRYLHHAKA